MVFVFMFICLFFVLSEFSFYPKDKTFDFGLIDSLKTQNFNEFLLSKMYGFYCFVLIFFFLLIGWYIHITELGKMIYHDEKSYCSLLDSSLYLNALNKISIEIDMNNKLCCFFINGRFNYFFFFTI
jgi:hypothetical protein